MTPDKPTLREIIIANLKAINKGLNCHVNYDTMNDKQLLAYYTDCISEQGYDKGYDDCCRDNPDENAVYLV